MTDYVVSKHINGRDWNGSTELGSRDPEMGWQVNRSTKREVMKKVRGRAQQTANDIGSSVEIEVYSGKGELQKTIEVRPTK